jgi:hypothetical protein
MLQPHRHSPEPAATLAVVASCRPPFPEPPNPTPPAPACLSPPPVPTPRLFESVTPLLPSVVGRLSADISPFCSAAGLAFSAADEAAGPWRNYFVGLVGGVAAEEEDILWPNQVGPSASQSRLPAQYRRTACVPARPARLRQPPPDAHTNPLPPPNLSPHSLAHAPTIITTKPQTATFI